MIALLALGVGGFLTGSARRVLSGQQRMKVPDTGDYSKFQHSTTYHARLPCLLCHRRDSNSAQPSLPGNKEHLPCAGCHVKQFADSSSPICTICHTNAQTGALKSFPKLGTFNMKFDHAGHVGEGSASCATCHRPLRNGIAMTIPAGINAHVTCFQCHGPQAKSGERDISSCGVCHQPSRYDRVSQNARAFKIGFSHQRHDRNEGFICNDCHRLRPGLSRDITSPQPLNHHASGRLVSCMSCHNGKRAFGGDDFSVCKRCHTGSAWHF